MAEHNDLGREGEEIAVKYLEDNGYIIKSRNFRFLKAEIDIIAQKGEMLSIIEVKMRSSDFYGEPQTFVSKKKIKLLIMGANHYVEEKCLDVEVQFDIIAITKNKNKITINHIENAFYSFE